MAQILCDIILKNGFEFNLCNFDDEIHYKTKRYLRGGGFKISAIEYTLDTHPANFQISGSFLELFQTHSVKDVLDAEVRLANFNSKELIFIGKVTHAASQGYQYTLDIASLKCQLSANITQRYSKVCRAEFCDRRCGLSIQNYIHKAKIKYKEAHVIYIEEIAGQDFNHGFLLNGQERIPILNHDQEKIELLYPYAEDLTYVDLLVGCDKSITSCVSKFNNAVNFRGEPWVPEV